MSREECLPAAQLLLADADRSPGRRLVARQLLLDPAWLQTSKRPAVELAHRALLAQSRGSAKFYVRDLTSRMLSTATLVPEALERDEVYDFTREVFYLADFGRGGPADVPRPDVVNSILRDSVSRALALRDDGLLIELLLARCYTCSVDLVRPRDAIDRLLEHAHRRWFARPQFPRFLRDELQDSRRVSYDMVASRRSPSSVCCFGHYNVGSGLERGA